MQRLHFKQNIRFRKNHMYTYFCVELPFNTLYFFSFLCFYLNTQNVCVIHTVRLHTVSWQFARIKKTCPKLRLDSWTFMRKRRFCEWNIEVRLVLPHKKCLNHSLSAFFQYYDLCSSSNVSGIQKIKNNNLLDAFLYILISTKNKLPSGR